MTTAQAHICALGWEERLGEEGEVERWWALQQPLLAAAARLFEEGWLDARISDEGVPEFRLSDEGHQALRIDTIREAHTSVN